MNVKMRIYFRYIVISSDNYGGHWGAGATEEEAKAKLKKAGGKARGCKTIVFTSTLPFAPTNRKANADEADCWVGRDGSISWVRCKREGHI